MIYNTLKYISISFSLTLYLLWTIKYLNYRSLNMSMWHYFILLKQFTDKIWNINSVCSSNDSIAGLSLVRWLAGDLGQNWLISGACSPQYMAIGGPLQITYHNPPPHNNILFPSSVTRWISLYRIYFLINTFFQTIKYFFSLSFPDTIAPISLPVVIWLWFDSYLNFFLPETILEVNKFFSECEYKIERDVRNLI